MPTSTIRMFDLKEGDTAKLKVSERERYLLLNFVVFKKA
jgi:hypothetical protein